MRKRALSIAIKTFLIYLAFLSRPEISAQVTAASSNTSKLVVEKNLSDKTLLVSFLAEKTIQNVLVVLSDQKGNTLFLDNKYRFRGEYKQLIDLEGLEAGHLQLQ